MTEETKRRKEGVSMLSVMMFLIPVLVTLSNIPRKPFSAFGKALNRGDMLEMIYKMCLGFSPVKDGNGRWDKTSDIPQLNRSVKSEGFTLINEYGGASMNEILDFYFNHVASTSFAYVTLAEDLKSITVYVMDKATFRRFIEENCKLDKASKTKFPVIRLKHETKKVLQWFKDNSPA